MSLNNGPNYPGLASCKGKIVISLKRWGLSSSLLLPQPCKVRNLAKTEPTAEWIEDGIIIIINGVNSARILRSIRTCGPYSHHSSQYHYSLTEAQQPLYRCHYPTFFFFFFFISYSEQRVQSPPGLVWDGASTTRRWVWPGINNN